MATSGYGNRSAGGNQFFQGPRGPSWHFAPRAPGLPLRRSSPSWGGRRPSPAWNYRLPGLPPATSPRGRVPNSPAPPPIEAPPPTPSC